MITGLGKSMAAFYLAGVLGLAVMAADPEKDAQAVEVRDEKKDRALADKIQDDFRNDPLFSGTRVSIDLYNGLAIVHGSAPTEEAIGVVNEKLKSRADIVAVFNFMYAPQRPAGASSVDVSYDDFRRLDRVGVTNTAFAIAQRVQDRLAADAQLQGFDIEVDTYMGLVILHGMVGDEATAKRAKDIAAYTQGVDAVLSYIDVGASPMMAPVTAAPIDVRPTVIDAGYTTIETRTDFICE
jgi:osmotically-inducible protein OsmY